MPTNNQQTSLFTTELERNLSVRSTREELIEKGVIKLRSEDVIQEEPATLDSSHAPGDSSTDPPVTVETSTDAADTTVHSEGEISCLYLLIYY